MGAGYPQLPSPTVFCDFNYDFILYIIQSVCNIGIKSVYFQILELSNFVINKYCLLWLFGI